jgi:hypothetical protein
MFPLQGYLILLLPVLGPLVGSTAAAILAQDHWDIRINDAIAWVVLLSFAGINLWASNELTQGFSVAINASVAIISVLTSGALSKLKPWLIWLSWVQSNVFDLVPLLNGVTATSGGLPVLSQSRVTGVGTNAVVPTPASRTPTAILLRQPTATDN